MTPRAAVLALVGRPFERDARGPDAFDCWGLVLCARAAFGLAVPPDRPARDFATAEARAEACRWRPLEALAGPREGAIAISERAAHAGIVVAGRIVHASAARGQVVASSFALWRLAYPDTEFFEWHTSAFS